MKNISIYLFASLLMMASCQESKQDDAKVVPQEPSSENIADAVQKNDRMCFLKVIEGKAEYGTNKVIRDSIIFEIERKGDSIYGIFDWKPYEKDKKISTYKGTIKGKTGTAIASYQAEGMEYDEELVFTLGEDQVSIIYGEMAEGEDGVWKYKNKEASSTQVLDKVDCK